MQQSQVNKFLVMSQHNTCVIPVLIKHKVIVLQLFVVFTVIRSRSGSRFRSFRIFTS